jgi:hypothetical protein
MMAYTTLAKIYEVNDCQRGWKALLNFLCKTKIDDDPIPMHKLVDAVGIMGAVKMLKTVEGMDEEKQDFMVFLMSGGKTQEEITVEFLRVFG